MENTILFPALVSAFFMFLLLRLLRRRPSNHPPSGPHALPIVGHLHLLSSPIHQTLARISSTYGPVLLLRFGSRPVLLVSSPTAAEECFTKNDIAFANRPRLLINEHLSYGCTNLGNAPYGPLWRNMIMQMIMQMTAGKRYYGESGTAGPKEGRRFRELIDETFSLSATSNPEDFLPVMRLLLMNKHKKRLVKLEKEIDEFLQEMVDRQRSGRLARKAEAEKKTILDVMLSLQETDAESYTDQFIKGMMMVFVFGRRH